MTKLAVAMLTFVNHSGATALLVEEGICRRSIWSRMERHFSQSMPSTPASSVRSPPPECPFASLSLSFNGTDSGTSTTSTSFLGSSPGGDGEVPPPSQITGADRQKITRDVAKILHTLLVAGYETTAISLSYVMYCLSKNPRCQERCSEEARRATGGAEGANDDDRLPYCRAVFVESTRLHLPVLFTTRVLAGDLTLDTGYANDDDETCTLLDGGHLDGDGRATSCSGERRSLRFEPEGLLNMAAALSVAAAVSFAASLSTTLRPTLALSLILG